MDLSLKSREWKAFFLNEIFTEIQRGKRLQKSNHKKGITPYVSSTSTNNGVDGFVGNKKNVRVFRHCLTLANSGSVGACFFQPFLFVASDHVTKLKNTSFNPYVYKFIQFLLSRLEEKYSFNREINNQRIEREKIILPITSEGSPDYAFMESYMRLKEQEQLKEYQGYITSRLEQLGRGNVVAPLEQKQWLEFEIGKLFDLSQGKSKGLNHLKRNNEGVNYLGATNINNGVLCQVTKNNSLIHKGNSIAFIRNGEGSMGYSVYKAEDFIATSDISVGYSPSLNRSVGLFITTIADKVRGKYNFGYKRSGDRLVKEKIMLPVTPKDTPDYDYMECYIKQLEYQKLKAYCKYKGLGSKGSRGAESFDFYNRRISESNSTLNL